MLRCIDEDRPSYVFKAFVGDRKGTCPSKTGPIIPFSEGIPAATVSRWNMTIK